ncbi:hypothetical protein [Hymenobacter fastidiosus]|uniref:hypothetical protein n=1 Tax=Hymenobacter fastidiosus TaxID=486264 RepID=UPI0031E663DC
MWGILAVESRGQGPGPAADTLGQEYTDARLGLRLSLPAGFRIEPYPSSPPDGVLLNQLRQLAGDNAARASVVARIRQPTAPRSVLSVLHLPGDSLNWLAAGFRAWRPGRYYRSSTVPPLRQELACALPGGGWLYLRAELPREPADRSDLNFSRLGRTLEILYGSRIFPALALLPDPLLRTPASFARYADSLVRHTPGGNPLPALAALEEGRRAAGASLITPAESQANPALTPYQSRFGPRLPADFWYLGDAVDKVESWTNAPAQRWLFSETNLDFISLPTPEYGGDAAYACTSGAVYSAREALADIRQRARGKQVVLFNENVYRPQHRTLLALALPDLYAQGFRYLAVETLNGTDADLNRRAYPGLPQHEFAPDYQFANLIRTARRLGFTLLGFADTTQPAGFQQTMPQGISEAFDKASWARRYQPIRKLRRVLDTLPPQARVVVLAPGLQTLWEADSYGRKTAVRLLDGWGGKAVLTIDQLHIEQDVCVRFGVLPPLQLPPPWQPLDSLARPDIARTLYVRYPAIDGPGLSPARPLTDAADLTVYNRLDAQRLPLPYPAAINARLIVFDLSPYRATSATGRRVLQLYLLSELSGPHPDQVPPVFTHEIGPLAGPLTLRLCPGRYRYLIRSSGPATEVQADLTVPE